MALHTIQELQMRQRLPLEIKIRMSQQRIREWIQEYGEDGVYISFSGGKDSTVLLHLVRELYPNVRAMFVDTGLEYPEIREFVKTFDNVDIVRPKMNFKQVIEKYGYPFISKEVSKNVYYAKKYLQNENSNDVHLKKMQDGQLDLSDLGLMTDTRKYKTTGCDRTGCMFCGYGCHNDKESRFERMKKTHPKQYDYIMRPKEQGGLNYKEIIDWINANSDLNIRY